ncbi:MAG: hypothetical protein NVSMB10_12550 [Steroidobacteraceae bacterium]
MNKILVASLGVIAMWGGCNAAMGYGTNLSLKLKGANNQFCMDASMDQREQDGDKVYVFKCTGHENQRWSITHGMNGQSLLVGLGGYCLDVRGTQSTGNGTPVQLWQCHYGKNQRFNVLPTGQIKEVESGKCLIAKGASDRSPVVLDNCTNSPMEKWDVAS